MNRKPFPLLLGMMSLGCVVWIREPTAYREEIIEMVEVRDEAITNCYSALLDRHHLESEKAERQAQGPYADVGPAVEKRMSGLHGTVGVRFVAARQTGSITATVVPEATTAPPEVAACVIDKVEGMQLQPADEREGRVTLVFQLKAGKRKAAAPAAGPPEADTPS